MDKFLEMYNLPSLNPEIIENLKNQLVIDKFSNLKPPNNNRKKAIPKNTQTSAQLHSSHTLVK